MKAKIPNIQLSIKGKVYEDGIRHAYMDLVAVRKNVRRFIEMLDRINEGDYSMTEVMVARFIFMDALYGHFAKDGQWVKGRYIRINGCGVVLLVPDYEIFSEERIKGWEFHGENGEWIKIENCVAPLWFGTEKSKENSRSEIQEILMQKFEEIIRDKTSNENSGIQEIFLHRYGKMFWNGFSNGNTYMDSFSKAEKRGLTAPTANPPDAKHIHQQG